MGIYRDIRQQMELDMRGLNPKQRIEYEVHEIGCWIHGAIRICQSGPQKDVA
jgi:hypothetical protein